MSILVVGATGSVGSEIARKLASRGLKVAGLVRGGSAHPKANPLDTAGVSIVQGDLAKPDSLTPAVKNVETILSTATSMPTGADEGLRRVDLEGTLALIDAASNTVSRNLSMSPTPATFAKIHRSRPRNASAKRACNRAPWKRSSFAPRISWKCGSVPCSASILPMAPRASTARATPKSAISPRSMWPNLPPSPPRRNTRSSTPFSKWAARNLFPSSTRCKSSSAPGTQN